MSHVRGTLSALSLWLAGCAAGTSDAPVLHEGDAALECEDGADNDLDGAFDCNDAECAGAPACAGDPGDDTDDDDPGTSLMARCRAARARAAEALEACGLPPIGSSGVDAEDCDEASEALLMECTADCAEAAGCGAFDASDPDAAVDYGDCVVGCVDSGGPGPEVDEEETADTALRIPDIHAWQVNAQFLYDATTDTLIASDDGGGPTGPTVIVIFMSDDGWNGDSDGICYMRGELGVPVARAAWADEGAGILFGFDLDLSQVALEEFRPTTSPSCSDLFGTAQMSQFTAARLQDVMGVGIHQALHADVVDYLDLVGIDTGILIGAGLNEPDPMTGAVTVEGYRDDWGYVYGYPVEGNEPDFFADHLAAEAMVDGGGLVSAYYSWSPIYFWVFN